MEDRKVSLERFNKLVDRLAYWYDNEDLTENQKDFILNRISNYMVFNDALQTIATVLVKATSIDTMKEIFM